MISYPGLILLFQARESYPVIPDDLFYTKDHVWVRPEENCVEMGVAEPLVRRLEPLLSIDMLDPDDDMKKQLPFAELEGRERTVQLYPPIESRIVEVNQELLWDQTKLVEDPSGKGWLVRVKKPDQEALLHLMTASAYTEIYAQELGEKRSDER